eukprot:CAMPEP_0185848310 /NCGR_PEP_ID=MMETSP1354-20130828/3245_1 /TAXON_ID=708628 /ORGANISM="Erythrolobus madagascarensis, Strain CCMP3276" /LENGTH=458 /DNA_ID=CAMNT_0028548697 /DNA_START=15 /DNA_END=1391 /DNA_ORIENTATION=-
MRQRLCTSIAVAVGAALLTTFCAAIAEAHGEGCGCGGHNHHTTEHQLFTAHSDDHDVHDHHHGHQHVSSFQSKLSAELQEAIPWVTAGVLLVGVLSVVPLPLEILRNELSKRGPFSLFAAAVVGFATPLCSCGALPLAAGFIEYGIPLSSVVTFLTASQSAGLDSAAITYGLLGPQAALWRMLGALIIAIATGLSLKSVGSRDSAAPDSKKKSKLDEEPSAVENAKEREESETEKNDKRNLMVRFIQESAEGAWDIYPLVLPGIIAAVAAAHYVPMLTSPFEAFQDQFGVAKLLLRIAVLASALPLQLCEHTTAAVAAGIQKAGGSAGLAFAVLLSAPATNLPTLLLITRKAGSRDRFTALKVAMALSFTALFLSYVIDWLGIDLLVAEEAESGTVGSSGIGELPKPFAVASPWIAGCLVSIALVQRLLKMMRQEPKLHAKDDCCDGSTTSPHAKKND